MMYVRKLKDFSITDLVLASQIFPWQQVQQLSAWTWTQERAELTGAFPPTCYLKCFLQVFANVSSSIHVPKFILHMLTSWRNTSILDFAFNLPDVFPSRIRIHSLTRPSLSHPSNHHLRTERLHLHQTVHNTAPPLSP